MKIYTKDGDKGWTSLLNNSRVSKSDDRIELVGIIDELNAHLGLSKVLADEALKYELEQIQRTMMRIMSGVVSSESGKFKISEAEIYALENRIDEIEKFMIRPKEFVLYGGSELSARLDVARAVARRAERQMCRLLKYHMVDGCAQKYINRLSDYLYVYARYIDLNF